MCPTVPRALECASYSKFDRCSMWSSSRESDRDLEAEGSALQRNGQDEFRLSRPWSVGAPTDFANSRTSTAAGIDARHVRAKLPIVVGGRNNRLAISTAAARRRDTAVVGDSHNVSPSPENVLSQACARFESGNIGRPTSTPIETAHERRHITRLSTHILARGHKGSFPRPSVRAARSPDRDTLDAGSALWPNRPTASPMHRVCV